MGVIADVDIVFCQFLFDRNDTVEERYAAEARHDGCTAQLLRMDEESRQCDCLSVAAAGAASGWGAGGGVSDRADEIWSRCLESVCSHQAFRRTVTRSFCWDCCESVACVSTTSRIRRRWSPRGNCWTVSMTATPLELEDAVDAVRHSEHSRFRTDNCVKYGTGVSDTPQRPSWVQQKR